MTNIEYLFKFANKHNFPKTNCEVMFNSVGGCGELYSNDENIISVKFDESLFENEIKIEDIRFDIDSDFPEDVFCNWQKDMPNISFKEWISMGRYIPTIIQNVDFFDELDRLTNEVEMKMKSIFSSIEIDEGDSDFYFDEDDDGDSDYYDGED
jgi:hypothetical protein